MRGNKPFVRFCRYICEVLTYARFQVKEDRPGYVSCVVALHIESMVQPRRCNA